MRIIDIDCVISYDGVDRKSGKLKKPFSYTFYPWMPDAKKWFAEKYKNFRTITYLKPMAIEYRSQIYGSDGQDTAFRRYCYTFSSQISKNMSSLEPLFFEHIELAEKVVEDLRDEGFHVTFKQPRKSRLTPVGQDPWLT